MMNTTDDVNTFGILGNASDFKAELSESKKVKLMYTSEFLKSFDKAPKSSGFAGDADSQRRGGSEKDNQIHQLRLLVFRLKDLITEDNNETTIKKMKELFNENEEGRQLLAPPTMEKSASMSKVPPIKLPSEGDFGFEASLVSPSQVSPTSAGALSYSALAAGASAFGGLPPLAPVGASSSKQLPLKSPGRNPPPPTPAGPTTPTGKGKQPNVVSPPANGQRGFMKRSPSMPVINNDRQKQDLAAAQAQLKLQKKTKSTENAALDKKKPAGAAGAATEKKESNNPDPVSPRRPGIKKSVSMSAICTDATLKATSLEEIVGQIYPLTKYQAGCRFLQKKLEEQPDPQHVTLVFNEVFEHLIELMTDPYGQYLVPKLMKYCDKQQRQAIVTKIAPKLVSFACHTYGIHGVQKILEFLTDDQVEAFVDAIRPYTIQLAKDSKGNYLIQSFLKQFPTEKNQFIFDALIAHCVDVSTHKVGCTLVNRCIDYANETQLLTLVNEIGRNSLPLVQDQFGNYVVQHLLSTKVHFAPKIIQGLLGHIPELSVQKFSSNVIEKCLQVATPEQYACVIQEITESNLLELLQDRYANFVIQTALEMADDQQHAKLVKMILPFIHQIKTPYVMHIQKKILQV